MSREIIYLDLAAVIEIHHQAILAHGGAAGFNGASGQGRIESALARPIQKAHDEGADLVRQAAALMFGLVKNHGFRDGNKRVGAISMIAFLHANGYLFSCQPGALADFTLRCSEPDWTEEAVEDFIRANTVPK